jgi:hypothetical protein
MLLLMLGCLMLPSAPMGIAAAATNELEVHLTPPVGVQLATVTESTSLDFWHYSGGYWMAGVPGGGTVRVGDSDLRDPAALASALGFILMSKVPTPTEVKTALDAGDRVAVVLSAVGGIMNYIEVSNLPLVKVVGDYVELSAAPKLNVHKINDVNYKKFGLSMTQKFPVVESGYGSNLYSIFLKSGGESLGWANAYYYHAQPGLLGPAGTIHPSQILNTSGDLTPGFMVRVHSVSDGSSTDYHSADVRIGQGTFANGGALGMRFNYPFTLTFYNIGKLDLSAYDLQAGPYTAGQAGTYTAKIKNDSDKTIDDLSVRGVVRKGSSSGSSVVQALSSGWTLEPGQEKMVMFVFDVPTDGTKKLYIKVEVKPELFSGRRWIEANYTNNIADTIADVLVPDLPEDTVGCSDVITWTETDSHEVTVTNPDGSESTSTCSHSFVYKTTLTTDHLVEPRTFKSGYGFVTEVDCEIDTVLVENSGCDSWGDSRDPDNTPAPPTKTEVRNPYKVVMKMENRSTQTQPYTVALEKVSSSATESAFRPAKNPVSELLNRKIYTPVELEGSSSSPRSHAFDIVVSGGGVYGVAEFCKTIPESITINGSMYEDDITSATR